MRAEVRADPSEESTGGGSRPGREWAEGRGARSKKLRWSLALSVACAAVACAPQRVSKAPQAQLASGCPDTAAYEAECPSLKGACFAASVSTALCTYDGDTVSDVARHERALRLASEGCNRGDERACLVARMLRDGGLAGLRAGIVAREAKAVAACKAGVVEGCMWEGQMQRFRGNYALAITWQEAGCNLGDRAACELAGSELLAAAPGVRSDTRALGLLERACRMGECEACRLAGETVVRLYPPEGGVHRDALRAEVCAPAHPCSSHCRTSAE